MLVRSAITCLLSLLLTSCGKFESVKPDPNQIVSIKNTSLVSAAIEGEPQPTPLPRGPQLPDLPNPFLGLLGAPTTVDIDVKPYSSMGRLSYVKNAAPWLCSAQLVGATGDVLLTAAHCVFDIDKNVWADQFNFQLGYQYGSFRQSFDWDCAAIFSGWVQNSYAKDYAFIKLRTVGPEKIGISPNSTAMSLRSVGYPSNFENARRLYEVSGNRRYQKFGIVEMTGNPFGPGSSGGAWIDNNDFAIGLNSFGYDNIPNSMFGPAFDGQTTRLYEFVQRGCSHDILPLGEDPGVANISKDTSVVLSDQRETSYGPVVKLGQTSNCGCEGAEEMLLENESDDPYEVALNFGAYNRQSGELISKGEYSVLLAPRSGTSPSTAIKLLGCSQGHPGGKNYQCEVTSRFFVNSMKKVVVVETNGVRTSQAITPEFCQEQCLNNEGGGYCRNLGRSGKPILKQLAGFLTDSLDKAPKADGVTTTKAELITAFGGDPADQEDPCGRSDFYRNGEKVLNDGTACIVMTPAISDLPYEPRLSLRSPPKAVAQRLANPSGTGSAAAFLDRYTAPVMEFVKTDANQPAEALDDLNKLYGGKVQHVQRRDGKLIATNENGCLIGDDTP